MLMRLTALIGLVLALLFCSGAGHSAVAHHKHHRHHHHHHHRHFHTARGLARHLAFRTWHSNSQWVMLDKQIVYPESHWDPCAYNPVSHDCSYAGDHACGIPQATPCPPQWRGRLFSTRWAQVRWLIRYVKGRYGNPAGAVAHKVATGWY